MGPILLYKIIALEWYNDLMKIFRKIIVWVLIVAVVIPDLIVGSIGAKIAGLVIGGLLVWWDVWASKKEKLGSRVKG